MAEFVRAQIFGTTFEITSRSALLRTGDRETPSDDPQVHRPPARRYGCFRPRLVSNGLLDMSTFPLIQDSSAKDQLTGQSVAVKKIMKPFSTPVLSKRTYRELKLLKHLRHENVGHITSGAWRTTLMCFTTGHQSQRHLHFTSRGHVRIARASACSELTDRTTATSSPSCSAQTYIAF